MAAQDVKGVVQTAIDAGGLANQQAAGLIDGRVKVRHDYYVADGTESLGSTIEFGGDMLSGSKILQVSLTSSVAQTTVTLSVGTTYDTDAFAVAGNTTLQAALTTLTANGLGYVVGTAATDSQIVVTTAGAALQVGTIYCTILYTTD